MRIFSALFFVLCFFVLSACSLTNVEPIVDAPVLDIPENADPSPIRFSGVKLSLPRGTHIASVSPRNPFVCAFPWGDMSAKQVTRHMERKEMKEAFDVTLETQGYDITGRSHIIFDAEDDDARSVYRIGARITDIKGDFCHETGTFLGFSTQGYSGETMMEVEWTVYDNLRKKIAYKVSTQGYSKLRWANSEGIGLLLDDAFASASHNLGADKGFHDLIVFGMKPANSLKFGKKGQYRIFEADEPVSLPALPLYKEPAQAHMSILRKVSVLIETGAGHGSGFFITQDGHIITNAHVVGDAARVRVVTEKKKYKLIGEVLRVDKLRDVALIRLEEIPDGFNPVVLPVRTEVPLVGEDIFAVGAPIYAKRLQDTVTKGIVSAYRPKDRWSHTSYIQGDVTIHPGNSGGPLLDAFGNIIGLSVAGYIDGEGASLSGLNLFVPVGEALETLDIAY